MRVDIEYSLRVEGIISDAIIGTGKLTEEGTSEKMCDWLYVDGEAVSPSIHKILLATGNPENPNPNPPFMVIGQAGTFAKHGVSLREDLIGRRCRIYSNDRFQAVSIEPKDGGDWEVIKWILFDSDGSSTPAP